MEAPRGYSGKDITQTGPALPADRVLCQEWQNCLFLLFQGVVNVSLLCCRVYGRGNSALVLRTSRHSRQKNRPTVCVC